MTASPVIPRRLRPGDRVRVVAPSRTLTVIEEGSPFGPESTARAISRLEAMGLTVELGRHLRGRFPLHTAPRADRLADLHDAFADPGVAALITVIGGWNANQLLPDLDWDLIRDNPKILCGYSDITALQNAILHRAGLVTYTGPHLSTFGMRDGCGYTIAAFQRALFEGAPYAVDPSPTWADDPWFLDQDTRNFRPNPGLLVLSEGEATGRIVGGSLSTFALLLGTPYRPSLDGALLFLESESGPEITERLIVSILQQPDAAGLRGLVLGRSPPGAGLTPDTLRLILGDKPELRGLPVLAGLDFGHTTPHATLPIGGTARVTAAGGQATVAVLAG